MIDQDLEIIGQGLPIPIKGVLNETMVLDRRPNRLDEKSKAGCP